MKDPATKTMAAFCQAFVGAERRLHANRGLGVPQSLANSLEDLQQALVGLTEATNQEREEAALS